MTIYFRSVASVGQFTSQQWENKLPQYLGLWEYTWITMHTASQECLGRQGVRLTNMHSVY